MQKKSATVSICMHRFKYVYTHILEIFFKNRGIDLIFLDQIRLEIEIDISLCVVHAILQLLMLTADVC